MKANEVAFQELLNGQIQYYIPLFQRKYTWKNEHHQTLWNDLLEIYNLEDKKSHFIGAFVTMPMEDSPEKCKKYTLIDGQQRLATLSILLSVIRDVSILNVDKNPNYETLASQINDECLINKYSKQNKEKFKLILTEQDREEFENVLNKRVDINCKTKSLIYDAYKFYFNNILKDLNDGDPIDLFALKSCITDYIDLVSIRLHMDDSPYKIFESLNHKGEPLVASDLIRNYVFMNIDSEKQEEAYANLWVPMEYKINESKVHERELDYYFWRYLMKDGRLIRDDDIYHEIVLDLQKRMKKNEDIITILNDFNKYSDYYINIITPNKYEKNKDISKLLNQLNIWKADVVFPFLLNIWNDRNNAKITEEQIIQILSILSSFIIRRYICDKPTHVLRNTFMSLIKQKDLNYPISSVIECLEKEWPSDELFFDSFYKKDIYTDSRKERARIILNNLEEYFKHKEKVDLLSKDITIEHIMPQTLTKQWEKELGIDFKQIHEKYSHTIGNLTLTAYNSKLANADFEVKKEILNGSHLELNKSVISNQKWTESEILNRGKYLAEISLKIWKGSKDYKQAK